MSNDHASNIARCSHCDKGSMHDMKNHDCHVSWSVYSQFLFGHCQNLCGVPLLRYLELVQLQNEKLAKSKANYTFSLKDGKLNYKWIIEFKMSNDHASNITRCSHLDKGSMHDMKSHDCHVFMECLLPITFWSLPKFVWSALTELSQFFWRPMFQYIEDGWCGYNGRKYIDHPMKVGKNIPAIFFWFNGTPCHSSSWKQSLMVLLNTDGCSLLKVNHSLINFNVSH